MSDGAYGRSLPQLGPITGGTADPLHPAGDGSGRPQGQGQRRGYPGHETFDALIHPTALISASAKVGRSCVAGPYSIIFADTAVGDFVGLNAHAALGHDVQIGAFLTLSAYVDLTGAVKVGTRVFFGAGARVMPGLATGAVMVRGAPEGAT